MAYVSVDIDLVDFDDDDLIEELKHRGYEIVPESDSNELLYQIYHLRRQGKDFDHVLEQLIRERLGVVI